MTLFEQDRFRGDAVSQAEETLRVIARLPAPERLVDRVQAGLQAAPRRRLWFRLSPLGFEGWMQSGAMRGLAAACIVVLVVGGGWQMYVRVQPPTPMAVTVPARIGNQGGFSSAGAMRRPDTVNGPVLTHQVRKPVSPANTNAPTASPKKAQQSVKKKHDVPAAVPATR